MVFVAMILLAVGGVGLWWWNDEASERHLENLIERAYDHADIDGPDAFSKYVRRPDECSRSGEQPADDEWRASMGGLSRLDSVDEAGPAAVRFADALEADGWDVQRYIVPSGAGDVAERRRVQAERDRDTLELFLQGVAVHVSGSTGPCNGTAATDLDDPPPHYVPIAGFPE